MQTINNLNCPTTRTRAVDARDNNTYWVQKLADGKCWMLTNLGYAGGGTNTYSDTKTLASAPALTYTTAGYYIPTGANVTSGTTNPSTSTNGTGQYGYLYNWCAAMGNQQSTSACLSAATPLPDTNTSICPAGWRLPVGNVGEFTTLNNVINGGSTTSDANLIANPWLAQRGGNWYSGFGSQGSNGVYWSSSQATADNGYSLYFSSSYVIPAGGSNNKNVGLAVRCLAS